MPRFNAPTIDEHKRATRSAILLAAESAFSGTGYEQTLLTDIADAAGVGRTTVYTYFESKADLATALAADRAEFVLEFLWRGCRREDPIDELLALVEACFELAVEHPEVAAIYVRVARAMSDQLRDGMWAQVHPLAGRIEELVARGMKEGAISGRHPRPVGRMVAELIRGGVEHLLGVSDRRMTRRIITDRVFAIRCLLGGGAAMASAGTGR